MSLRDKSLAIIVGTNGLSLLKDKWIALIGGQMTCPLLGDKWVVFIGGQMACPYWRANRLFLLGDNAMNRDEGAYYLSHIYDDSVLIPLKVETITSNKHVGCQ